MACAAHQTSPSAVDILGMDATFSQFSVLDIDAVRKLVTKAPTNSCPLDPLPTFILKDCLEELLSD